jgi:hypothetical protein
MKSHLVCLVVLLVACGKREPAPAAAPSPAAAPTPGPTATPAGAPAPAAAPALPPQPTALATRPGGPTVEACGRAADHLKELVVDTVEGTREQRAYVEQLVGSSREAVLRYCLELAVPREIECVLAARSFEGLSGCENHRREISEELALRSEPTEADCGRFYDRLRQFRLAEGVSPAEMDRDRDQIIRTCQERARAGTIACFVASPTYEQARRCP